MKFWIQGITEGMVSQNPDCVSNKVNNYNVTILTHSGKTMWHQFGTSQRQISTCQYPLSRFQINSALARMLQYQISQCLKKHDKKEAKGLHVPCIPKGPHSNMVMPFVAERCCISSIAGASAGGNMIMNKGIHPGATNRLEHRFFVCFGSSEKLVNLYTVMGSLPWTNTRAETLHLSKHSWENLFLINHGYLFIPTVSLRVRQEVERGHVEDKG